MLSNKVFLVVLFFALLGVFLTEGRGLTVLKGTPYLFNTYSNPVDPNRGADLAPAFQAQYGTYGAELVAYFGTGNL